MIDLDAARNRILDATPVLGGESVHILDSLKRVLSGDILVTEDFPVSDISAMDGYAVQHRSLAGASEQTPVRLKIIGESPAGRPFGDRVGKGEAVRIMTGGLVPDGADTVVKIEDAREEAENVVFTRYPIRGDGIRFRGESLKKGDVVLRAGDVIGPVEVGLLATLRRAYVQVHQKPLVAILSTGDELTDFHDPPSPSKTMCSALYSLTAHVMESGAVPLCLGVAQDNFEAQKRLLSKALRADVIITTGGMSKGKYDLIQKSFASFGMVLKFSSISAKPGKPSIFGIMEKKLVFGLPGNPCASLLSFEQFIQPALFKMMGHLSGSRSRQAKSHWRSISGPVSGIDSFANGHADNRGHLKASLVPLGRVSSGNDGRLKNASPTDCDWIPS